MLTAINLNHNLAFQAHEINDIWTDRLLPTELDATQLSVLQSCP